MRSFPGAKRLKNSLRRGINNLARRQFYHHGFKSFVSHRIDRDVGISLTGRPAIIYVDVTVISGFDAGTGIQRVVRSIAAHLASPARDAGFDVRYCWLRNGVIYEVEYGHNSFVRGMGRVEFHAGDIFLALDHNLEEIWKARAILAGLRRTGVQFWYLVHDFLPLERPQWFSSATAINFKNWLAIVVVTADGIFFVSDEVRSNLEPNLLTTFGVSPSIDTCTIPMGALFDRRYSSRADTSAIDHLLAEIAPSGFVLMVGTIEPRKGHGDLMAAMTEYWAAGGQEHLVLVGASGWKMQDFEKSLRDHSEYGRRLHWVGKITDEALEKLYHAATGVVVPSLAEGFGLPLVEALARGKPVLARDIAVFRSHERAGLTLFPEDCSAGEFARRLKQWLKHCHAGGIGVSFPPKTWAQSAAVIIQRLSRAPSDLR